MKKTQSYITICVFFISFVIIAITLWLSSYYEVPYSFISKDPNSIADHKTYYGILSNIGAIFWSFSVAMCFFTYFILKQQNTLKSHQNFILTGGIVSSILLIDDFFMFHEAVYPQLTNLSEIYLFALYGVLVLFYLIKNRTLILENNYFLLLLALIFFATSIGLDLFPETHKFHHFFEDVPKFLGITSWFSFHFQVCNNLLLRSH